MELSGHDLKVRRVDARVSNKQLAAQLGWYASQVSRLEAMQFPTPWRVTAYLAALETCQNVRKAA